MVYFKLFSHCLNGIIEKMSSIILGHPNLVITCSNRKCVVVSNLQYFTVVVLAHLVKYSSIIMIYLTLDLLVGGLIGPTKSISHLSNTLRVT
jgi:hypothetical protein